MAILSALVFGCHESTSPPADESGSNEEQDSNEASEPGEPDATSSSAARDAGKSDAGRGDGRRGEAGGSDASGDTPPASSDVGGGRRDAAANDESRDGGQGDGPMAMADAGTMAPTGGSGQCGSSERNLTPFGCKFAWGTNDPDDKLPNAQQLNFYTKWIGWEVEQSGALPFCDGCNWLKDKLSNTEVMPVYYAYFIGFFGSKNGFMDQNVNPNGPNLATHGAQLIRDHRAKIIEMYAWYARESAKVWPTKPMLWMLEGDFVQYTYEMQMGALSMKELAELARDITCAIKGNMPNAVVAINHSTWLSDEVTNAYWDELARVGVNYDMVWTTGVANNMGFLEEKATPDTYNAKTATYAYLFKKTGRKLLVDTSFGLSGMADTWATASPETLNMRIAEGVIAANVTMPPSNYVAATQMLTDRLDAVCE